MHFQDVHLRGAVGVQKLRNGSEVSLFLLFFPGFEGVDSARSLVDRHRRVQAEMEVVWGYRTFRAEIRYLAFSIQFIL